MIVRRAVVEWTGAGVERQPLNKNGSLNMLRLVGLFLLVVASNSGQAISQPVPLAPVERLQAGLLVAMRAGASLGLEGRRQQLDPVVRGAFDFPYMIRLVIGRHWEKLDEPTRARLTEAFSRMSVFTYADRFDDFSGERFEMLGEQPGPRETIWVETRLLPASSKPVRLNYLTRLGADNDWRIIDVFVDGTVSELTTRRAEYGSVIGRLGVEGLIVELENKVALAPRR
ncbi:MAG: toluene tolerance protein [Alphaproteobacteria bacterium]|nr:toluene tolerance protein [Alphaproteobacteria bacterium]